METLIAIAVFGVVGAIMYLVLAPRAPIAEDMIQRRLETISGPRTATAPVRLYDNEQETFWERVADFFFGSKEIPENLSRAGTRLHQAGYRGIRAIRIYWGLRIFLALALTLTGLLLSFSMNASMQDVLLLGGAAGALGYMLPYLTVFRKAKSRVLAMREALPDTLDLIVVCVEAGMGVDAALNRVGNEQNSQKLAIGEELLLATQEMQAGARRKDALIRLAERCGVEEIRGLVTFLTQTEELGGSIARSLRIYAETMRDKRSQSAEEAARKSAKTIKVVPTQTLQAGLGALVAYEPARPGGENAAEMTEAAGGVRSGSVARAHESGRLGGLEVEQGHFLGLVEGEPVTSGPVLEPVARDVVERLIGEASEVLTVLIGESVDSASDLVAALRDAHPELEIEVHEGGQRANPLLFAVE